MVGILEEDVYRSGLGFLLMSKPVRVTGERLVVFARDHTVTEGRQKEH